MSAGNNEGTASASTSTSATCQRPPTDETIAIDIVKRVYGIQVESMKELNGYEDRNYLVKANDGRKFVLKVTNNIDSKSTQLIDASNDILLHVAHVTHATIKVPVPIKDTHGKYICYESLKCVQHCGPHAVRLLAYVDGKLLKDVACTRETLVECGLLLARLNNAFDTYTGKAIDVFKTRDFTWSIKNVPKIKQYLDVIENKERRTIVENAINAFQSHVLSLDLECGIIHGDMNEMNIIVEQGDDHELKVNGVIDFSDVHYAPRVFDLAMLLTYLAFLEFDWEDSIIAIGYAIKGYASLRKIKDEEFQVLLPTMAARLCQSLVLGIRAHQQEPDNQYVITSQKGGWKILEKLASNSYVEIMKKWRNIIES